MSSPITSFDEVQMPADLSYGATGGSKFNTMITELASGFEQRNVNWSKVRGEWDVSYNLRRQDKLDAIRAFFMARRGRAIGFRFKDWADYQLARQSIGQSNGTTTIFQIYKRYASGPSYFDRDLTKIVSSGIDVPLKVWFDGSLLSSPTIDLNTGKITLNSTQAATTGKVIEVACEFDVPARFDTDHIAAGITAYRVFTWGGIPIKEIRV